MNDTATFQSKGAGPGKALITNQAIIIVWRIVLVLAGLVGVIADTSSLSAFANKLSFFTIQSNIILVICVGLALWASLRKTIGPSPFVMGAATLYISITGLVYNIILVRILAPEQLAMSSALTNALVHQVTPVMAVVDWLLFQAHGKLRWRDAFFWLAYPAAYFVFVLIRAAMISAGWFTANAKYTYPFLDVDKLGYGGVALNFLIYGTGFYVLALLFVGLDRLLAGLRRSETASV
jgi:hypothetical protein